MSGGRYDYAYVKVQDFADDICKSRDPLWRAFGAHCKLVADAMYAIEWVDSGDSNRDEAVKAIKAVLGTGVELKQLLADADEIVKRINAIRRTR